MERKIIYRQISAFEQNHYFISSDGKLFRVREVKSGIGKQGRGYKTVAIFDKNGTKTYKTIHSIVAEAFIGPRPKNLTINHVDGNKYNNNAENLEYVTVSDNVKHAYKIGIKKFSSEHREKLRQLATGRKNIKRKLSSTEAVKMIETYRSGLPMKEVGKKFGMSASSVHRVVHGTLIYKEIKR